MPKGRSVRAEAAPDQADAGQKQQPEHDVAEIAGRSARDRFARRARRRTAWPARPAARAKALRAVTKPVPACRHSDAVRMVQLKVWKMPRRSSLPQPRTLAHRIGSGPDRPARPPRMPPANPTMPSAARPPNAERHRAAVEIQRGRKHQQQHADAQFEHLGIGMRDQQRAQRHAGEPADQERPHQAEVDRPPDRRQRRGLRDDGADQDQRHRDRGRQHVEPDPERHQRGAEAGEAGHEAAGERAGKQQHKREWS